MKFKRSQKVNGLPLELSFIKDHLRVTGDDEDGLIKLYANSAVDLIYKHTWHLLRREEFTFYLDDWEELLIPISPIISVDSVKYYDSDGVQQTLATSDWYADVQECPGKVFFDNTPNLEDDRYNAIEVTVTAGYLNKTATPDGVLNLFLILLTDLYENRQSIDRSNSYEVSGHISNMMNTYSLQVIL